MEVLHAAALPGRPRSDLIDAGSSPRVFLSPLVLAALAILIGADVLLYLDLRSPTGTLLWAVSLAAAPAAFAWRERSTASSMGAPVPLPKPLEHGCGAPRPSRSWFWR